MNKITAFLIFTWIVTIVIISYPTFAKGQVVCGERAAILSSLESSFGEKLAEQGVDTGLLVAITVNLEGRWSFLITPKGKPNTFCVPASGTSWTQDKNSSKGITNSGSVLNIIHEDDGSWEMLYFDKKTGAITSVTTGYAWERLITLSSY